LDIGRLFIDADAVIITEELKNREAQSGIVGRIGSTGSGTGAAVAARINREESLLFAKDLPELKPFVTHVPEMLRNALGQQERIIIEGTQGFGLSPLHARHYPYTTSRDTTAAAFLAETGLSPLDVDDVILTIRAFPIRVAGNSGPLAEEINWQIVTVEGGHSQQIEERTSVTKKSRRVARFDEKIVKQAIIANAPTRIVLNHIDYLHSNLTINKEAIEKFIHDVEYRIARKIDMFGYGPESNKLKRGVISNDR